MTNKQALEGQIATWRRKLADHEAALSDAGALAVAGDTAGAAQAFQQASIGVQVAQAAIAQLEGQRAAAAARDDLDRAIRPGLRLRRRARKARETQTDHRGRHKSGASAFARKDPCADHCLDHRFLHLRPVGPGASCNPSQHPI